MTKSKVMTVPRTTQEIIDNADKLARQFEEMDVDTLDWRDATPLRHINAAVVARGQTERQVADAVNEARAAGFSWALIGAHLGTSAEAARQRYGLKKPA